MLALSSMTTIQQRASVVRSPAGVAKDTSVDVGPVAVMSVVVTAAVLAARRAACSPTCTTMKAPTSADAENAGMASQKHRGT